MTDRLSPMDAVLPEHAEVWQFVAPGARTNGDTMTLSVSR